MPFMSGDTIILSSLFVLYKNEMKNDLDKFIITTHYCLMKQGFTVRDAIEGSEGVLQFNDRNYNLLVARYRKGMISLTTMHAFSEYENSYQLTLDINHQLYHHWESVSEYLVNSKLIKLDDLISKLSNFISTTIEEYVFNPPNTPLKGIKHEQDASFGNNNKSSSINPRTVGTINNPPNTPSKKIKREQDASFGNNNNTFSSVNQTTVGTINNPPNTPSKRIKREQDATFANNNKKSSSINPTTVGTITYAFGPQSTAASNHNIELLTKQAPPAPYNYFHPNTCPTTAQDEYSGSWILSEIWLNPINSDGNPTTSDRIRVGSCRNPW
ncbi:unnamed protein product [Rotaria sordida]|uniref:Uncharacterized protein n=2 Tax=Rotaria sordida TaxID=392033 RepID=A0A818SQX5_9BILA|nr:unnamed protein product [Rotaria sordida]